ncbi:ABC transporter permease [Planosporangium thailandense]|uniref:ABC transporter permease n=1 Tax=Planosporangium thailandense TaxID=765197 RepID=A0ABX0XZM8_9ACTN|nr:ABC transporter permease [Planosporangium thailandense]
MSALGHLGTGSVASATPSDQPVAGGRRRRWVPYVLLLPGILWLLLFFAIPCLELLATSLYDPSGSLETGYAMTWHFANYSDAVREYAGHFGRSIGYAALTTLITLLIGYPLAYAIALKGGRWKNLMLVGVIAPFFTSFLIRTLAWKVILSDDGPVVSTLNALHVPLPDGRLLATGPAVIAGLVYNFLPFMVLPLYASLEKLDPRLLEAAGDLYARPVSRFFRVALPLSMPGVVAGTLLTFIPAAGDYINAQLLGTTRQYMIGNVIESKFLKVGDYPGAAALSFALMAAILVLVLVYVRRAGTEEVL